MSAARPTNNPAATTDENTRTSANNLAWLDGRFMPLQDATVSVEDRGFQFGDAVYEVIFAYDRNMLLLKDHLERLQVSASAVGIDIDVLGGKLEGILREGVERTGYPDVMVYVQITRGVCPRGHLFPEDLQPTIVATFREMPRLPKKLVEGGARAITMPDIRWDKCYIKAVTLLPNVLAKTEAKKQGAHEAIFVTETGEVREGTSSNVFLVSGQKLITPTRNESILHGVTQKYILACASDLGIPVEERTVTKAELFAADEVFISSTAVEILGVTQIDDQTIATGQVGPITKNLHAAYLAQARAGALAA